MPDQPRDRGICGALKPRNGIIRSGVCELLAEHTGWHEDRGMSWTEAPDDPPRAFTQADVDAAYQRGLTEGRRLEREEREQEDASRD